MAQPPQKQRRVRDHSPASTPDASTKTIRPHSTIQNQATNQIVHGSQFYGNVNIHHSAPAIDLHTSANPETSGPGSKLIDSVLASLAFPGMLDRRENISQPHAHTCNWLFGLPQYQAWRGQYRGLLWIKGKPGSGKSTLMSFLRRKLQQEQQVEGEIHLDFFFHARGSELQYTLLGLLRSLMNQLLRSCSHVSSDIMASYSEKRAAYGNLTGGWEWQQPELESLLSDALISSCLIRPITVFIDALDEAGRDSAQAVVNYLYTVNDRATALYHGGRSSRLKMCISSRHYPIVSKLTGFEIHMEVYNTQDIVTFVHDEMDEVMKTADHVPDRNQWDQLADMILQNANGVFQWARLVINILIGEFGYGWSLEETRRLLESLPQELEDVYDCILRKFIKPSHIAETLLLFQWVCLAKRPLSLRELMCATAAAPKDPTVHTCYTNSDRELMIRRMRSLSGGLVELATGHYTGEIERAEYVDVEAGEYVRRVGIQYVQVTHQTVRDYFREKGLLLLLQLRDQKAAPLLAKFGHDLDKAALFQQCHLALYSYCLDLFDSTYIHIFAPLLQMLEKEDALSVKPDLLENLMRRLPFLRFATQYMFHHAQMASCCQGASGAVTTGQRHNVAKLERVRVYWFMCFQHLFRNTMYPHGFKGSSLLQIAVYYNVTDLAERLINCGSSLEVQAAGQTPPLCLASSMGNLEMCKTLLVAGVNVNAKESFYGTALQAAALSGHDAVVQMLVDAGADINIEGGSCGTALGAAAAVGNNDLVRMLIDLGADVNAQGPPFDDSILDAARSYGHEEVVKSLLDAGAE